MSGCSCQGGCGGTGTCGGVGNCDCAGQALRRGPGFPRADGPTLLRSDDGNECGSGHEPRRAYLRSRGSLVAAAAASERRLLVPGLGDVPAAAGPDGTLRIDGNRLRAERSWRDIELPGSISQRWGASGILDGLASSSPEPLPFAHRIGKDRRLRRLVELGYRATQFTVPLTWYTTYLNDLAQQHRLLALGIDQEVGLVSSVANGELVAFSDLIGTFGTTGADPSVWKEMLGCYNLPRETMPDEIGAMFWGGGWGPPYRVYELTNMLVLSTSGQIKDICTGHASCKKLGTWVEAVLRGKKRKDRLGKGPCRLKFRFMNSDTANAFVGDTGERVDVEGCGMVTPTFCDRGFLMAEVDLGVGDPGERWNYAFPGSFDSSSWQWVPSNGGRSTAPGMPRPGVSGDTLAYVRDGSMTVTQRPEMLAWEAFVCDYILFLSRLAFDYARDPTTALSYSERDTFRQHAWDLGRYALRILASRGRILIHELGHAHNGSGGHCNNGECCFELAAQHWLCSMTANWGMPLYDGAYSVESTWTAWVHSEVRSNCNDTSTPPVHPWVLCALFEPGAYPGASLFACHSCGSTDVTAVVRGL
jgi:hypothetical protein